jgi:hypothetical protein
MALALGPWFLLDIASLRLWQIGHPADCHFDDGIPVSCRFRAWSYRRFKDFWGRLDFEKVGIRERSILRYGNENYAMTPVSFFYFQSRLESFAAPCTKQWRWAWRNLEELCLSFVERFQYTSLCIVEAHSQGWSLTLATLKMLQSSKTR